MDTAAAPADKKDDDDSDGGDDKGKGKDKLKGKSKDQGEGKGDVDDKNQGEDKGDNKAQGEDKGQGESKSKSKSKSKGKSKGKGDAEAEDTETGAVATGTAQLQVEWVSPTSEVTLHHYESSDSLTLNNHTYRQCATWGGRESGRQGKVGSLVYLDTERNKKGGMDDGLKRVVISILQRLDDLDNIFVITTKMSDITRKLMLLSAHRLADVSTVLPDLDAPSNISHQVYKTLYEKLRDHPDEVTTLLAPAFGLPEKRDRRKRKLHNALPEAVLAPTPPPAAAPRNTGSPAPAAAKQKKTPRKGSAKTGTMRFQCTRIFPNGFACSASFPTAKGLVNHTRTHKKEEDEEEEEEDDDDEEEEEPLKVLKLTVDMMAYKYMTAPVGEYGVKRKEVRSLLGGKSKGAWIRSRLVGREYDSVKLYGGDSYCNEKGDWTVFKYMGHTRAGTPDGEYTVPDYGGADGFEAIVQGEVWEILLGKVLDRQCVMHPAHGHVQVLRRGGRGCKKYKSSRGSKRRQKQLREELEEEQPVFARLDGAPATGQASAAHAAGAGAQASMDMAQWMQFSLDMAQQMSTSITSALTAAAPQPTAAQTGADARLSSSELAAFRRADNSEW